MATDPHDAAHTRAVSALNDFHDYYAQTAQGEGTDVDFLWQVSSALADALTETLLALSQSAPDQRQSIHERLTDTLLYAIERRHEVEPALALRFVESEGFREVVESLPEPSLARLLISSSRGVRSTLIASLGAVLGPGEQAAQSRENLSGPGRARPR